MLFSFHCPSCRGKLEVDASLSGRQADCPQCGKAVAIPEARVDAGTTLAGFRLERRLGKGGMGEVYLATQLSVGRQVAVKVLPPGFATNPEAVQRFLHEGRLAARLDHGNIVTVHEAGQDAGTFYLAMAYVEGESLDQRLKRGERLPESEALAIVRFMADALAYAWDEFQLLHRDIKPANIMVDRRGRVFLMDLGLAKSLGEDSGLTLSGSIVGTPQYMSPEQAQGLSDLGVPTDVYALGATLYHLVTGSAPFVADSALKVLSLHVNAPLPPPRARNPAVSEGCSGLIERMMAKRPSERYGDWRALIADIDRVLAGAVPVAPAPAVPPASSRVAPGATAAASGADLARQAHTASSRQSPAASRASAPGTPAALRPTAPRVWRSPWMLVVAAAALVVVGLAAILILRGRDGAGAAQAQSGSPASPTSQTRLTSPTTTTPPAVPPPEPPAPAAPAADTPATPPAPPEATAPATPAADTPADPAAPPEVPAPTAPLEEPGPAPEPPPKPAPPDLAVLARPILSGRAAEAAQLWQERAAELGQGLPDDTRQALGVQLEALAGMDRSLLASLKADTGKTIELDLGKERIAGEVREATADGIRVMQAVKQGQGSVRMLRTVRLAELSLAERLRRLGEGDTPELGLQRGLLAVEANRLDTARKLFEKAGGPLGEALVAALDIRRDAAKAEAAEQAVVELLRQISTSPKLDDEDRVTAAIRKRIGDDLKRLQAARKALAAFEKEWGDSEAGRQWAPVVRRALMIPIAGDTPLKVPELGIELIPLPAGEFLMGMKSAPPCGPLHRVRLTKPFWLGKYEVTQAEYAAITGQEKLSLEDTREPVDLIPWVDAAAFCTKLTERERAAGRLPDGYEYRLPTEAEWEYACKAGTDGDYAARINELGWHLENTEGRAHPVGQKKPNAWGLYDMLGNAFEWCLDWFDAGYYSRSPTADPVNLLASGNSRAARGGGVGSHYTDLSPFSRSYWAVDKQPTGLGLRVCLGPVITLPTP